MVSENTTNRDDCYICGEGNEDILETHHIVPRRFGGGDESENLVDLCPTCHRALEKLYDKRFYDELGVEKETDEPSGRECCHTDCTSEDASVLKNTGQDVEAHVCSRHQQCSFPASLYNATCTRSDVTPVPYEKDNRIGLLCDKHRICWHGDCGNTEIALYDTWMGKKPLCDAHAEQHETGIEL